MDPHTLAPLVVWPVNATPLPWRELSLMNMVICFSQDSPILALQFPSDLHKYGGKWAPGWC